MSKAREIRELIRKISGTQNQPVIFFNAEVVHVTQEVCSVKFGDIELGDVRLSAVVDGNANNMIVKPVVGSMVLVADMSLGEFRELQVISCTEIESISINGGQNEGIVKVVELTAKLNALEDAVNQLKTVFTTWIPIPTDGGAALKLAVATWAGQTITRSTKADLQNDKIKH